MSEPSPLNNPALHFSTEVAAALRDGRPVVALESTILTHGMPWPQNLEMATGVESLVRSEGCVPATIAVLKGELHVGLEASELEDLAQQRDALKLSRADLAFAISQQRTGATTVAATMIAASLAGIEVFATGGIGGVHRGAETSFDISADLEELAKTPVIVVAAGAKAILDIPKTLELLETKGVPVVTYQADNFPAFWSRSSGLKSPLRLDSPDQIAAFQRTRSTVGTAGGLLLANPVPVSDEIPAAEMEAYIETALGRATELGISGKDVTPFLLAEIFTLTEGASLETNIALVRNNASVACAVAKALVNVA